MMLPSDEQLELLISLSPGILNAHVSDLVAPFDCGLKREHLVWLLYVYNRGAEALSHPRLC